MSLDWPEDLPDWVVPPPDIALRNWRERVARVCEEECADFDHRQERGGRLFRHESSCDAQTV